MLDSAPYSVPTDQKKKFEINIIFDIIDLENSISWDGYKINQAAIMDVNVTNKNAGAIRLNLL